MPTAGPSRLPVALAAVAVLTAAFVVLLRASSGPHSAALHASDVVTTLCAVAAALSCLRAGATHAGWMRAFWWLLAAGCAAWATGEGTWTWYEVVLHVDVPYPSWADVGYLAAVPLTVAAFACHPAAHHRHHGPRLVPLLDAVAAASALLFVSWTMLLTPLWTANGGRSLGDLVAVAYPFGDVVMLFLVGLALRNLPSGNRPATLLLLLGLLVMAASDSYYTYLAQHAGYQSGDLVDAGWVAAYLLVAAAGRLYESPLDRRVPVAAPGRLAAVVPYVPVVLALAVIAVQLPRGKHLTAVEMGIAVALTTTVLVRQLLQLAHRRRPAPPPSRHRRRATDRAAPVSTGRPSTGRPSPGGQSPGGQSPGGQSPGGPVSSAELRQELQLVGLELAAAARTAPEERVSRVSATLVTVLMSLLAAVALWDLLLVLRGTG